MKTKQAILCVDDDPGIHKLLAAQLKANDYTTHHATSGDQAIDILSEKHVDLIILDLKMPGMNGFAILAHVKETPATKNIPVIFLSSFDQKHLKIRGFEYGADDFIVKPFTGPILLARINAVLRRSGESLTQRDAIRGNVKDLPIFDLLRMLSFSDKCRTVLFPEMNGRLLIDQGNTLSINQASHTGEDALVRLLLLNKGTFSVHNATPENDAGPDSTPIETLLFATAIQVDEIEDTIQEAIPASQLDMPALSKQFEDISTLKGKFPLSPQQLCAEMPGNILDNVRQIAKAFSGEVLIGVE